MIQLTDLSKSFDGPPVVDQLELQVQPELFVFLGPNGAGKTTTIKMMTGLLTPDAGDVLIDGVSICNQPVEAKRKFGYVPEFPALYEKLTPVEFLDFIANAYAVDAATALSRMEQLFDILEIHEHANALIQDLSNGMKKKVSIIAALLHRPPVLFLDEPTAALDPKAARNFKDLLRGHVQRGGTVFMTTHVLEIAESVCDRIGIIHQGRLRAVGTLRDIKTQFGADQSLEDIFLSITGSAEAGKVDTFLES